MLVKEWYAGYFSRGEKQSGQSTKRHPTVTPFLRAEFLILHA
jgi:hypothetical protein